MFKNTQIVTTRTFVCVGTVVVGADFVRFKNTTLKITPYSQVALLDNEDMNAVDGDDDWQFVSIGEQQNFGIRTAGLEEKATACQMLVCYARELKDGFADYTEQVSPAFHLFICHQFPTYPIASPHIIHSIFKLIHAILFYPS